MKIRHVLLLIGALLLFVFVGANWQHFTAPVALDLIVGQYQAPLGLIMLSVLAVFAALFLLSVSSVQSSALKKKLQATQEIEKAQRTLIDAEGNRLSRFEEVVRQRFQVLETKLDKLDSRLMGDDEPRSRDKNKRSGKQTDDQKPAIIGSALS